MKIAEPMRSYLAVGFCVISAVLGVFAIRLKWGNALAAVFDVATLWIFAGNWLCGHFTAEEERDTAELASADTAERKPRKLLRECSLAKSMVAGGCLLLLADAVAFLLN